LCIGVLKNIRKSEYFKTVSTVNVKTCESSSAILAMRPVRHRPEGPCSKGAANIKLAFNTVRACLRTKIVAKRSMQYTDCVQQEKTHYRRL